MGNELRILKHGQTGFGLMVEQDAGYISPTDRRNLSLIQEVNEFGGDSKIIDKPLELFVVLQKWGVKNRNSRIYPQHILEREVENYQKLIKENRAIGELDHPDSSLIAGDRISHNITETWWDGKTLMGKMKIIMTPGFMKYGIVSTKGDEVANLVRNGIMVGVSSRGVGSLQEINGNNIVQDDFELICWDVVTAPSTPGSWMFKKQEQARPFMESVGEKKSKLIKNIDNFLLD